MLFQIEYDGQPGSAWLSLAPPRNNDWSSDQEMLMIQICSVSHTHDLSLTTDKEINRTAKNVVNSSQEDRLHQA